MDKSLVAPHTYKSRRKSGMLMRVKDDWRLALSEDSLTKAKGNDIC